MGGLRRVCQAHVFSITLILLIITIVKGQQRRSMQFSTMGWRNHSRYGLAASSSASKPEGMKRWSVGGVGCSLVGDRYSVRMERPMRGRERWSGGQQLAMLQEQHGLTCRNYEEDDSSCY